MSIKFAFDKLIILAHQRSCFLQSSESFDEFYNVPEGDAEVTVRELKIV